LADERPNEVNEHSDTRLSGTSYKVYRHMLKQRGPVGISEVQRQLGLSSPSVAQYHLRKLVLLGLVKEEQGGYVVDKVTFENVVRIRRISIPVHMAYVAFFGVTFLILLVSLRPATVNSLYFFAIIVNVAAIGVSLYEASKTLRRL
jgi:predicted DNA-binding transcriptional regulator